MTSKGAAPLETCSYTLGQVAFSSLKVEFRAGDTTECFLHCFKCRYRTGEEIKLQAIMYTCTAKYCFCCCSFGSVSVYLYVDIRIL